MTTTVKRSRAIRVSSFAMTALLASSSVAQAQIAVLTNTVEERIAAPGETYRASILVVNTTDQQQRVRIYQTDYRFSADGTSEFADIGSAARSNAAWVTPASQQLVLPPRAQMPIAYTVRVPATSGLSGTFWSTIMVEGVNAQEAASRRGTVGLGTVVRYAVQVATHIQATGSRNIAFSAPLAAIDSSGARSMDVIVANTGERAYRPMLWVELYDRKGDLLGKAEQTRGLLYPGTSLKQTFRFADVPRGSYKAIVFADTGDDAVFATQYKLDF